MLATLHGHHPQLPVPVQPMNPYEALLARHSTPSRQLGAPGPDRAQLLAMLQAAVHVPDHGRLAPWRFVHVAGAARDALGNALADRLLERDPGAKPEKVSKERARFSHAPDIVAVVSNPTPGHKVPESEQVQSGSCVCFALLQAADALGFGAQWLTGWAAYDPSIRALLGIAAHEHVLGFVHIGTVVLPYDDRARPDAATLLTEWSAP